VIWKDEEKDMKTITRKKSFEDVNKMLEGFNKIYIFGCGTCATMCGTGGNPEVSEMKKKLQNIGKVITDSLVIPTACDDLTKDMVKQHLKEIKESDAILVMACAFGVQTIASLIIKPVFPALDTLFIGREEGIGYFAEICMQCGECVLDKTAGICPVTRCAKSLLNGPCGGSVNGKCEVDPNIDCAWQLIYDRLKDLGQLKRLEEIIAIKDWSKSRDGGPRSINREDLGL